VREVVAAVRNSTLLRTEHRELRTRLLINSRTDVALAAGADGVHLRSDDLSPDEVRQMLEASAHRPPATDHFLWPPPATLPPMSSAPNPRTPTSPFRSRVREKSSAGTPPAGLAALREACRAKIRVLALGGVTVENAASCLEAGAAGVAAIRLFQENKIEDVVRALRAL